jgi:hypothetical protein
VSSPGFKIVHTSLVIPDLEEVVRCIETDAPIHEKKRAYTERAEAENVRIEEQLNRKSSSKLQKRQIKTFSFYVLKHLWQDLYFSAVNYEKGLASYVN